MIIISALSLIVGVIDGGAVSQANVETVATVADPTRFGHGEITVKAMEEAAGQPVAVLYASAFERIPEASEHTVRFSYRTAIRGMEEMKRRGAKYICTTFLIQDEAVAADMISRAQEMGLVLVTSLGNGEVDRPFPAMMPGVVAVLGTEAKVSKTIKARADYTVSGKVSYSVRGSSFAAARVCGQLAAAK